MSHRNPGMPFVMAMLGVPVVACAVTEVAYQISRRTSGAIFTDNVAYLLMAACTLIGVVLIQFHGSWSRRRKIITAIIYFPIMYVVVLMVMFFYMVSRGAVPVASH